MHNSKDWKASKFVFRKEKLTYSENTKEVIVESRFAVGIVASFYNKYLKLYAKGRLLDLGCGKVPLYEAYRCYISDNICIDWAGSFHKNSYLDYEHDLNQPLPLNDGEFDTIILSDVLEHIKNPEKLWEEMSRVLKKEGVLIMNVPFYYWLHEIPHDYYRFTEFALRKFAEENNFEVVILTPIGGILEIFTDLTAKISMRIPVFGKFISIFIQSFSSLVINSRFGRKRAENTGKIFPFGYFLVAKKI